MNPESERALNNQASSHATHLETEHGLNDASLGSEESTDLLSQDALRSTSPPVNIRSQWEHLIVRHFSRKEEADSHDYTIE